MKAQLLTDRTVSIQHAPTEIQALWGRLHSNSSSGSGIAVVTPDVLASRLDYTKDAVSAHVERLKELSPHRKVAIISFADTARLFVAGRYGTSDVHFVGVNSLEQGLAAGRSIAGPTQQWPALAAASDQLLRFISSLDIQGGTALGLAVAVAIGITS